MTWGEPGLSAGWAIPAATDIAFALGVLALLGNRVPLALKVFLLALAIIDDLGAIVIIAVFYSGDLSMEMLAGAAAAGVGLVVLNRLNVRADRALYPDRHRDVGLRAEVGRACHACRRGAGLCHPDAGAAPTRSGQPPLQRLEHKLAPWVAYGIMPLFAFANAGVSLDGLRLESFLQPLPLGILLGLFLGKQLGVFAAVWLTVKVGLGATAATARPGGRSTAWPVLPASASP